MEWYDASTKQMYVPIPVNLSTHAYRKHTDIGSLSPKRIIDAVHFGKTHDMGSLRGFKHKEPVAKPFTDPEFPVNNDSFLDVGTCEDAVAYLSNPPQKPLFALPISKIHTTYADL